MTDIGKPADEQSRLAHLSSFPSLLFLSFSLLFFLRKSLQLCALHFYNAFLNKLVLSWEWYQILFVTVTQGTVLAPSPSALLALLLLHRKAPFEQRTGWLEQRVLGCFLRKRKTCEISTVSMYKSSSSQLSREENQRGSWPQVRYFYCTSLF